MRSRILAALLGSLLLLPACQGLNQASPGVARASSPPRATAQQGVVSGSVSAPAGFIGQDGASFIGQDGASFIGQDGASYHTLLAAGQQSPLANAEVYLADASGRPLAKLPHAKTDAHGRFKLTGVPAGYTFLVVATAKNADGKLVALKTLSQASSTGSGADIDAASTCVAIATLRDSGADLGQLNASAFTSAVSQVQTALKTNETPDLSDSAAVLSWMQGVSKQLGKLQSDLDAVKADLAKVQQSLNDLDARVSQLEQRLGSPAPSIAPATLSGTFKVGALPRYVQLDWNGNVWVSNYSGDSVTELASNGDKLGEYPVGDGPLGLAVDAQGNVWSANLKSNNLTELSPNGVVLNTVPVDKGPFGLAFDRDGNLWVGCYDANEVLKLSPSGDKLLTIPDLNSPTGLSCDQDGNMWVASFNGNTLTKLAPAGDKLGAYDVGPGHHWIAPGRDRDLWVVNTGANRVDHLSLDGTKLTSSDATGKYPWGLAVDGDGNVWTANQDDGTLSKFGPSGKLIANYQLGKQPQGLTLDAHGQLWAVNKGDNTVMKLPLKQ